VTMGVVVVCSVHGRPVSVDLSATFSPHYHTPAERRCHLARVTEDMAELSPRCPFLGRCLGLLEHFPLTLNLRNQGQSSQERSRNCGTHLAPHSPSPLNWASH
jgi:hypothetical protein